MRHDERIEAFKRLGHNPDYLTTAHFNVKEITFSSNLNDIVAQYDTLIFVTPSPYLKQHLQKLTVPLRDKLIVTAIKGIVPDENMIVSEYFHQVWQVPYDNITCIGGPSHAEEVALERLSYLTIGCTDGLKYGDNFQAVFLSNAIQEMKRFLEAVNATTRCIDDSAYLGDLLVTAYSKFSRNRTFGKMIGRGYSVKSAQIEMEMIAEGYYGTKCMHEINKTLQMDMPILETVYRILYKRAEVKTEIQLLTKNFR